MWSSRGLSNAAIYSKVNFNLNYLHVFGYCGCSRSGGGSSSNSSGGCGGGGGGGDDVQ